MKKVLLNNFLAMVLILGLVGMIYPGSAVAEPQQASPPKAETWELTGVWEFTFTGESLQGDPDPEASAVILVKLYDRGDQVLGILGLDRLAGSREGKTVRLKVYSHGEKDSDVKAGGIQSVGEMRLKLVNKDTLTGQGFGMIPANGVSAFEVYRVTAVRTQLAEAPGLSPSDLCHYLHIDDIIADILGDATAGVFEPMDVCTADKDGGGFYVLGRDGPGPRLYATATFFFPWETTWCSVRDYYFAVHSRGPAADVETLLQDLQYADDLLKYLGVDADWLVDEVRKLYESYGEFAISIMINYRTKFVTIFINLGSDVSTTVCDDIQNSSIVKQIRDVFDRGSGLNIKCGQNLSAHAHLRRNIIPDINLLCSSPVIFVYVLGTINVNYD